MHARKFITLLLFIFFCVEIPAIFSHPFVLDSEFSGKPLGKYLLYYEDKTGTLTIEDVQKEEINKLFLPVMKDYPSFGYSHSAFWFKLIVHNPSQNRLRWILDYNYPIIDLVELYFFEGGKYIRHVGGDSVPFHVRQIRCRSIAFPIHQPPGESTIYLRVKSEGSLTVPLEAHLPENFSRRVQIELALLFLHYGIMLALFLYNLFIFISYKEKSYLFLSLFLGSIAIFSMTQNGIAFQFLWPNALWWTNVSNPFFLFLSVLCALAFSRFFLNMKKELPRFDVFVRWFMYLNGALLAYPIFGKYHIATQLSTGFAGITVMCFVISGAILVYRKNRAGVFLLSAWSAMIVGTLLTTLRAFGFAPSGIISTWGYQAGASVMALLLSFAVADQLKRLRQEKEDAMKALRESEEKYRALVENAREGILLVVDGMVRYANKSFVEMTGYSEEELYSLDIFTTIFPPSTDGTHEVLMNYLSRIEGKAAPEQYEARIKNKYGNFVDVFISAVAIRVEGKMGTLSIVTNISSLKKAEKTILQQFEEIQSQYEELEALNEELVNTQNELLEVNDTLAKEREKLAITLRSIADSVITTDVTGKITYMNPSAEKIVGISFAEAEGKKFSEIFALKASESQQALDDPVYEVIAHGNIAIKETTCVLKKKEDVVIEINGAPLKDKAGSVTGTVFVLRDVTARVKLENEINKINRLESLGVLAGGIAHDFNNLLTAVLANASLLKKKNTFDEKAHKLIAMIEKAGERAANLTRQLLTFARGGEPIKTTASVMTLLRESIELTLTGTNCICKIVNETPEENLYPLWADSSQIAQVFNNLLINAVQAMPLGGTITIFVANSQAPQGLPLKEGNYVRIAFRDEGEGIPPENIGKIFDPYFTTKERGYGLGLATCYSIIKRHDGYIHVESTQGKGSTFVVFLPSAETVRGERELKFSNVSAEKKYRILIMDDEEYIRETLSAILDSAGHKCTASRDGREAIEKYKASLQEGNPFDIVIMDLTVPGGMGGKEAVVEFTKFNPRPILIVSSGYSNVPVLSMPYEYGFDGAILKPYSSDAVIEAIESVMKNKTS
ncbi:MAG: PAS domain S-box protein [Spirochaetes bacterium]|nr:PAS domain S-box protein [Spirochaetota bacterium]